MNKVCFLTMDVESYYDTTCLKENNIPPVEEFCCASQVDEYLSFLNKKGLKATFFVVISFLPYVKETLLKAVKTGHEIGLHAYEHHVIKSQDIKEFEKDIKESISIIKKELGVTPVSFRAPCFEIDEEHLEVVRRNGLVLDSSLHEVDDSYEKLNDIVARKGEYFEFTVPTKKMFGRTINLYGGGYARTLPIQGLIKKNIKKSNAYIFYFHPFEINPNELPLFEGIKSGEKTYINRGRKSYFKKIRELIEVMEKDGYQFMTFSEFAKVKK